MAIVKNRRGARWRFWNGKNNWDDTEAKQHKFTKGVLQCGQTLAHTLGTLFCQVVGFTSKPEGFDMKRLYRLERALWNALGRLALLWQWRGGNAGWMGGNKRGRQREKMSGPKTAAKSLKQKWRREWEDENNDVKPWCGTAASGSGGCDAVTLMWRGSTHTNTSYCKRNKPNLS